MFALGLFVGVVIGVFLMSLMVVTSRDDFEE